MGGAGCGIRGLYAFEFDDDAQTLVLTHNGKTYASSASQSGMFIRLSSKATLDDAATVLSKMKFEQMMTRMIDQQKQTVSALSKQMLGPMGATGMTHQQDFRCFPGKGDGRALGGDEAR